MTQVAPGPTAAWSQEPEPEAQSGSEAVPGWGLYCGAGSCRCGCCPQAPPERARRRQPWGVRGVRVHRSSEAAGVGATAGGSPRPGLGARGKPSPTWQLCPSLPVPGGWPAPSQCPLFTRVRGRAGPAPPSHVKPLGPEPAPGATKGPCPLRSFLRRCPRGLLPSLRRMGVASRMLAPLWALALALAYAQHIGKAPTERLPGPVLTWQPRGPPLPGAALGLGGRQTAPQPGPSPGEAGLVCERLAGWTPALALAVLRAPACGFGGPSGAAGAHVGEGPLRLSRSPEMGKRNPASLRPPTASPAGGHVHLCYFPAASAPARPPLSRSSGPWDPSRHAPGHQLIFPVWVSRGPQPWGVGVMERSVPWGRWGEAPGPPEAPPTQVCTPRPLRPRRQLGPAQPSGDSVLPEELSWARGQHS